MGKKLNFVQFLLILIVAHNILCKKFYRTSSKNETCLFDEVGLSFNQNEYKNGKSNEIHPLSSNSLSNEKIKFKNNTKVFETHGNNEKIKKKKCNNKMKLIKKILKEQKKKKLLKKFRVFEAFKYGFNSEENQFNNLSKIESHIKNSKSSSYNKPQFLKSKFAKEYLKKISDPNYKFKNCSCSNPAHHHHGHHGIHKNLNITNIPNTQLINGKLHTKFVNSEKINNNGVLNKSNTTFNDSSCDDEENKNITMQNKSSKDAKLQHNQNTTSLFYNNENTDCNEINFTINNSSQTSKVSKELNERSHSSSFNGKKELQSLLYNNTNDCKDEKNQVNITNLYYNNTKGCTKQELINLSKSRKMKNILNENLKLNDKSTLGMGVKNEISKNNNEMNIQNKFNRIKKNSNNCDAEDPKEKNMKNLGNFLNQLSRVENIKRNTVNQNSNKDSIFNKNLNNLKLFKTPNQTSNCDEILNPKSENDMHKHPLAYLTKIRTSNLKIFSKFPNVEIFPNDKNSNKDCEKTEEKQSSSIINNSQNSKNLKTLKSSMRDQKLSNEFNQFMKNSEDTSKSIELIFIKYFFENFIKGYQSVKKERIIKKWGKPIRIEETFKGSFKCNKKSLTSRIPLNFFNKLSESVKNLKYENLQVHIKGVTNLLNKLINFVGSKCQGIDIILNMITKEFNSILIDNKKKIQFNKVKKDFIKYLKNSSFLQAGFKLGEIYGITNTFTK